MEHTTSSGFAVDPAALHRLVSVLRRMRCELEGAVDGQRLAEHCAGSRPVSAALDQFVDRWTDGRNRINANLDTLVTSLEAVLADYTTVDDGAASSFRGNAP